jgi:sodium-dependent phosphate cotransporter
MGKGRVETVPLGTSAPAATRPTSTWMLWLVVLLLVYVLIVAVDVIGRGFSAASGGAEGAERIFAFATNPLLGAILGTLATALVQSSSTVSSVIVGLVAGGLPVSIAIPMIMGANMGTTITNTIVSLGNLRNGPAFNRSFGAATVHDFFNLLAILIFLPIEAVFHPLERLAGYFADMIAGGGSASMADANVVRMITRPTVNEIRGLFGAIPEPFGSLLMIAFGIALVILAVLLLGKVLRRAMTGSSERIFHAALGRGPLLAIVVGAVITILVQSSSTTTSLVVPLAGAGILTLAQVYPFTLGANIGTCITALLAATAVSGAYEVFAVQVALVHLLYNTLAVVVIFGIPFLRDLPVRAAKALADGAERSRWVVAAYVLGVFFVLPGAALLAQSMLAGPSPEVLKAEENEQQLKAVEAAVQKQDLIIE